MNPRVAGWALLCAALVAVGLFFASAHLVARWSAHRFSNPHDDLEWLRREFRLSQTDLERIRLLHEGYLPQCREWCAKIAAKKAELEAELAATSHFSPRAAELVRELASLRAECQIRMLQHFAEVSRAMPADQGRRYLAEMLRLTLGAHEQTERAMAPAVLHPHAHP